MPDTLIGSGDSLENMTIGLDTVVFNEHKHWYRAENNKLYSKLKITQDESGKFMIYLTGEPDKKLKRSDRRYG